jgi:hypothetical protein
MINFPLGSISDIGYYVYLFASCKIYVPAFNVLYFVFQEFYNLLTYISLSAVYLIKKSFITTAESVPVADRPVDFTFVYADSC